MKRTLLWLMVGLCVLVCAETVNAAGERTNIQGLGMARTFVASSRGLDAVGINPANLAGYDRGTVTIGLMPFGVHLGSDFMTLGLYNRYFTGEETSEGRVGRYLHDEDKQDILAAFPEGMGRFGVEAEVRPIGITLQFEEWGSFALSVTERVSAEGTIPKDYARFILYGNTPGSVYDLKGTDLRGVWMREYAFSFGKTLPAPEFLHSLAAGFSVKLVHGYGFYAMERFESRLVTTNDGILGGSLDVLGHAAGIDLLFGSADAQYNPFPSPAGSGIGFDLGVAADVTPYFRLGVSVTDIGSLEWTSNVKEVFANANVQLDNPLSQEQRDSIENAVRGDTREGSSFSTSLPTTVRGGIAVQLDQVPAFKSIFWGKWLLAADYNQGIVAGPGAPALGRFSVGLEFKPWDFLPLRTGFSVGGPDQTNFALGFGLHLAIIDLDFASENLGFLFDENTLSYGSLSAGVRIRI